MLTGSRFYEQKLLVSPQFKIENLNELSSALQAGSYE